MRRAHRLYFAREWSGSHVIAYFVVCRGKLLGMVLRYRRRAFTSRKKSNWHAFRWGGDGADRSGFVRRGDASRFVVRGSGE